MRIPFCPLPLNRAKVIARKFYGLAGPLVKTSRGLDSALEKAEIGMGAREYMSIVLFTALFMFATVFLIAFLLTVSFANISISIIISLAIATILFFVTIQYLKMYPKLLIKRRIADIERNLLHALRHLYVQVQAGVSIFQSITSVSTGSYGAVSEEFRFVVKKVNAGMPVENALEELVAKNPSVYFRRVIWQISNGIKAGADIGTVMKSIIDNISAEQRIEIRKYGSKLNPLTLVYMMIAVIMPVMGITFMIVISSFSGLSISESMFWMILVFLAIFQFMFIGIIKSKRPNLI